MRKKYTNVAIPVDLASEIDKTVKGSTLGYSSRAQFVLEAVRQRILQEKETKYKKD
jgi:metal-responsive CopG/Arc/MetJ family transcriptional regulator